MPSKLASTIIFNIILNAIMLIMVTVMISYRCTERRNTRSNWVDIMDYESYVNTLNSTCNAQRDASGNNLAHHTWGHSEVVPTTRLLGSENRIVGGKPIGISHVPSMAAMVVLKHKGLPRDALQCGVTIIDKWWVVTAAHCIDALQKSGFTIDNVVIASGHRKWNLGRKHPVKSIIMHRNFDEDELYNDIALMCVKKPFKGKYEIPAPVASSKYAYKPNEKVKVVGWGYESDDGYIQEELHAVDIKLMSKLQCEELYGENLLSSSMICAGDVRGGKDACAFDSGGPLYHRGLIVGIVSWGKDCGDQEQPGVYTRIGMFEKWIKTKANKPKARTKFLQKP